MPTVLCRESLCRYSDELGECQKEIISLGTDLGCNDFEYSYEMLNREYQKLYTENFYKCVRNETASDKDKQFKKMCKGEKIIINDVAFYTDSTGCLREERYLTHGRTGRLCGTEEFVSKNFEHIIKTQKKLPDVTSLPDMKGSAVI